VAYTAIVIGGQNSPGKVYFKVRAGYGLWTKPAYDSFFQIAVEFRPAAIALVAQSADRMAAITRHSKPSLDAAWYRIQAARSLREALESVSKENANGILCTSILMAHQQHDWQVVLRSKDVHGLMKRYRKSWRAAILGVVSVCSEPPAG
jgi:hypothetical protein